MPVLVILFHSQFCLPLASSSCYNGPEIAEINRNKTLQYDTSLSALAHNIIELVVRLVLFPFVRRTNS